MLYQYFKKIPVYSPENAMSWITLSLFAKEIPIANKSMRQEQTMALHAPRRSHLEEERVHTEEECDDGKVWRQKQPVQGC